MQMATDLSKFYRRLCVGLNTKGKLIPANDDIYKHIKNQKDDHYVSIYLYDEEQKKKFYTEIEKIDKEGNAYKTIHGARNIGEVVTNKIVFDFDCEEDVGRAKSQTLEMVERLSEKGIDPDDLLITFSGKKGFGIELTTDQTFTPDEAKTIAKNLADGLDTFDTVVYNASRVVRIPFTKHQGSGLFKIPIEVDDLEGELADIVAIAKDEYEPEDFGAVIELPEEIVKMKNLTPKTATTTSFGEVADLDLRNKPRWLSNWKYALQEGFFPPGTRNSALMILGATYKGQGFNKITTYRMLKSAADLQAERVQEERHPKERIWKEIIEVIYDELWNGGTYAEDSFDERIVEYLESIGVPRGNEKEDENALLVANDVFDVFEDFAENIEKNTIKTGIDELDNMCRITTSMLVGVLGAPGSGKTSTVLNIFENHSTGGETSIFFSFDMGKPLVYQKLVQKQTGMESDRVFKVFVDKEEETKQEIKYKINNAYKNVQMCFKTGATVDDMRRYITDFEQSTGKKVRMIAVDYLEKLVGPFSDATANSGYNAAKLQELCNDLELCCLLLLQPQKMAGDPSDPLLTYRRVKGASVIEQDCRVIISVFREGYHPQSYEEDDYITFAVLKNTMGTLGQVDCLWNGLTGDIFPIDDQGREELKKLRKRKKEQKALEDL